MKRDQFTQTGKRSNNEDSFGVSAGLLTVCDGVGGHVSGEIASAFVVQAMSKAFDHPGPIDKTDIQNQLYKVQKDLNSQLDVHPEQENMGTTFTGVFITPKKWYAAHIGDSRIYLFRPSEQKLWHTWDHSLVGELMRTKEITCEAGRFHPMSNHISKAIIAQKDGKPVSASIVKIDEMKKGDILMLCTDGIIEAWGNWELVRLFSDESLSFEQKCEKLRLQCAEKSRDNNTAIIAEIEDKDAFSFGNNDELEWTTFTEVEADYKQYLKESKKDIYNQVEVGNSPLNTSSTFQQPIIGKKDGNSTHHPLNDIHESPPCVYGPPTINKRSKKLGLTIAVLALITLIVFIMKKLLS